MNTVVIEILESALGVESRRRRLERYGTWTRQDAAEFDEALAAQRRLDEKLWR